GTFPRVLGVYCRNKRLFSWETAVHKMTGMAAAKLGLKSRGLVRTGWSADLAIFDPATVSDAATFADPHRHPIGIPYVVVNGQGGGGRSALQPAAGRRGAHAGGVSVGRPAEGQDLTARAHASPAQGVGRLRRASEVRRRPGRSARSGRRARLAQEGGGEDRHV